MTDAEYFKNVIELQKERYHPATNTGCTNVMTSRLERAIKDLERLAAIDEVLRENDCTDDLLYVGSTYAYKTLQSLIFRNLLPKAEVASDEDN